MSGIDIDEMVRMASSPRRQLWEVNEANPFEIILPPEGETGDLACIHHVCTVNRGMPESVAFIANAPAAILTLSEQVTTLQAQNAALQARAEALGEWQGVGVVPPVAPDLKDESTDYEILVPATGFYRHKTGEWIQNYGSAVKAAFYRPFPDDPTAAESEE